MLMSSDSFCRETSEMLIWDLQPRNGSDVPTFIRRWTPVKTDTMSRPLYRHITQSKGSRLQLGRVSDGRGHCDKWKKEWASSHTCTSRSNIFLRKLYTTNGTPDISDGQSDRKTVSSELHKIILAKVQKGFKLLLKKIKSTFPVKMHTYTLCPSYLQSFMKFCSAVSVEMRWRFSLLRIFHISQICKFNKGVIPRKKLNQSFMWICISKHHVLYYYKVSGNSVERFQRSCADKKNRTDGLTDWRNGSKIL